MKVVSAAVIIKNNMVLIAKRAIEEKLAGYWEFPGGKQEENETIFTCLERELFEEFQVKVKALDILCESIYEYENGKIRLVAILTELYSDNINLSVHDEVHWVSGDELLNYKLAPADIPIAKYIKKELL